MEQNTQKGGFRKLKVYERYVPRPYNRHVILPEIRLAGKWLQELGFGIGQPVKVWHEENRIVITVGEEAGTDAQGQGG